MNAKEKMQAIIDAKKGGGRENDQTNRQPKNDRTHMRKGPKIFRG
jgi:hypothetical protein